MYIPIFRIHPKAVKLCPARYNKWQRWDKLADEQNGMGAFRRFR